MWTTIYIQQSRLKLKMVFELPNMKKLNYFISKTNMQAFEAFPWEMLSIQTFL